MTTIEQQVEWEEKQTEQLRLLSDSELSELDAAVAQKARELLRLDMLIGDETTQRNGREVE